MRNIALEEFQKIKYCFIYSGLTTRKLYSDSKIQIFFQDGISHSVRFWGELNLDKTMLFITTLGWYHSYDMFSSYAGVIARTQPLGEKALDCFLICCNSHSEVINARKAGFKKAILCNLNAFLDENLYNIDEKSNRIYSLVLNTRPEKWKRPYFAKDIKDLAIIKGTNHLPNEYYELKDLLPAFINEHTRLDRREVCSVLNKSHVGGIFSEEEGSCCSSGEFLLSGLPVISTPCRGGREIYYNSDNHIIVNEPVEVKQALDDLIERFKNNPELRCTIRDQHIRLSRQMLKKMFVTVNQFMAENGCQEYFEEIYMKEYRDKMAGYTPLKRI